MNLIINERLNNPDLIDSTRVDIRAFAINLLKIGNGFSIQKSSITKEDVAPWAHGHVPEYAIDKLIDKVYPNLYRPGTVDREYLSQRAILTIANKDVAKINSKLMT